MRADEGEDYDSLIRLKRLHFIEAKNISGALEIAVLHRLIGEASCSKLTHCTSTFEVAQLFYLTLLMQRTARGR
jgi:hypothetical protein